MVVQYFTNIPSPYRVEFFNELAKYVNLTVVFERESASDRNKNWFSEKEYKFETVFLDSIKIGTDNSFCTSVIKSINLNADIIIIGIYSTYTAMIIQTYLQHKKKPYVINSDGGFIVSEKLVKKYIKSHYISKASYWLSTGDATSNYLEYYGAERKNIYTYPFSSVLEKNVYNPSYEEKICVRKELGLNEKSVILSVGQIIHRKGYDILLYAASQLKKDIIWIVIGGEITEEYRTFIEKYQIKNVHFLPFMSKEDLRKYYIASDLFVLPTREDIWGLVINEAMSYGLPVVTTNRCIAGMEMIDDGVNGYICNSDDVDDFVKKVNKALTTEFQGSFRPENSLNVAKNYSIEKMALRHYEIFREISGEN